MGTVLDFGTPWHTAYPYHGVTGIHGLISNGKSFYILFLLLFLKYFISLSKVLTKKDWSLKLRQMRQARSCLLSSHVPLNQQRMQGLLATIPTYGFQGGIRGKEKRVGRE